MTRMTNNHNLSKGDVITVYDNHTMYDSVKGFYKTLFVSKFKITRVNQKTYTCQYIDGPHQDTGFGWIKTDEIKNTADYYYEK